jgi:hypothetical protein
MTGRLSDVEPVYRIRPATLDDTGFLADVVVEATRAQGRLSGDFNERTWRTNFTAWTEKQLRGEVPERRRTTRGHAGSMSGSAACRSPRTRRNTRSDGALKAPGRRRPVWPPHLSSDSRLCGRLPVRMSSRNSAFGCSLAWRSRTTASTSKGTRRSSARRPVTVPRAGSSRRSGASATSRRSQPASPARSGIPVLPGLSARIPLTRRSAALWVCPPPPSDRSARPGRHSAPRRRRWRAGRAARRSGRNDRYSPAASQLPAMTGVAPAPRPGAGPTGPGRPGSTSGPPDSRPRHPARPARRHRFRERRP